MSKHKIIITGITRDNAKDISSMMKHIEYVGNFFADYRVILFENDSKDGTKTIINEWKNDNHKVKIVTHDFNNSKRPNHKFLADARNYYINAMNDKEYEEFDIIMVIDMDMGKGIDIRGIEDSFSKIDQWDAVCSNGIRSSMGNKMGDVFAFRNDELPWTPSIWQSICEKKDNTNSWTKICKIGEYKFNNNFNDIIEPWIEKNNLYWKLIVPQGMKVYPINSKLINVQSCFGGMAIYKRKSIANCVYDSIDNDCEHISLHQFLREKNNGKMVMNPNQVIRYD